MNDSNPKPETTQEECSCGLWVCVICRPPGTPRSVFIDGYFTQRTLAKMREERRKKESQHEQA